MSVSIDNLDKNKILKFFKLHFKNTKCRKDLLELNKLKREGYYLNRLKKYDKDDIIKILISEIGKLEIDLNNLQKEKKRIERNIFIIACLKRRAIEKDAISKNENITVREMENNKEYVELGKTIELYTTIHGGECNEKRFK